MNKVGEKTTSTGKRRVTVDLDETEVLIAVREDSYYRLGQPMDEVVRGHVIAEAALTSWCSVGQEWVR